MIYSWVSTAQETGWVPELVRTWQQSEKSLPLPGGELNSCDYTTEWQLQNTADNISITDQNSKVFLQ